MYINISIGITLILVIYWKARNQYYDRLDAKFRYRLFDLRDKLRELALGSKVDCSNVSFKYLDSSLSKTVNQLYRVNIWTLLFFPSKEYNSYNHKRQRSLLMKNIFESKYTGFIYLEYVKLIMDYVSERHYFLMGFVKIMLNMAFATKRLQKFIDSSKEFAFRPETSSIDDFCTA